MTTSFAGRTVIITGAGRGLGHAYALDLAARGANIVVNDVGAPLEGNGTDGAVALAVVDAIRAAGGSAIASTDDVASPDGAGAIVQAALDAFGTVDALVNNAGITIRKPFEDMTAEDFAAVHQTHVFGSFNCCKAVWPVMKAKGHGRIVNTTSVSGAYGMLNQINYSTAKAGIIGFTRALALEGQAHGILVNAISPMAMTRMSAASQKPEFSDLMTPDWTAALVAWFASDAATVTGQVVSAGMGYFARMAMVEAEGVVLPGDRCDPDVVGQCWALISDMSEAREYGSAMDYIQQAIPAIMRKRAVQVSGRTA